MAGHQSQVQWGAWDGPGSRVVGGACTLVDVLTRSGLPRQSSENTKAKRHSRSIIHKGPAKFWRVVVQTRLPMCPGPRSTRDRVSRGIATYRLWESRRPKGWFSKQIWQKLVHQWKAAAAWTNQPWGEKRHVRFPGVLTGGVQVTGDGGCGLGTPSAAKSRTGTAQNFWLSGSFAIPRYAPSCQHDAALIGRAR